MKLTSRIAMIAYIILMVIVAITMNNTPPSHETAAEHTMESPAVEAPATTVTPPADAHDAGPPASEDPMAHKEAVEPNDAAKEINPQQAMLGKVLETIVNVDHRKPAAETKKESAPGKKPSPDVVLAMLKKGNDRFVNGQSTHPHLDTARLKLAAIDDQGDHAYATVITCSDSRVPVEAIFDTGIMDIFVIRVAGNVCDVDERGSIEYGLAHVHTPVLVVLGHTQCGAVTAVTHAVQGHGHPLERNIPPLVANIAPAVKKAMDKFPELQGDAIIPKAIEENVWTGIEELFMESPATRDLVKTGAVKVIGAIYDVGTGQVSWLPEPKTEEILTAVEASPHKAVEAMAGAYHKKKVQCPALMKKSGKKDGHGQSAAPHPIKCPAKKACKTPCEPKAKPKTECNN